MTITLHPVAGWAWVVVAGLVALALLLGLFALLKGDEVSGWLADSVLLAAHLIPLAVAVAVVLTATSFIFT